MIAKERSAQRRHLFAFERVREAADGVLSLAFYLVGLAVGLQLGVTDCLANDLFHGAFDLFRRSDDPVLIHGYFPNSEQNVQAGEVCCCTAPFGLKP
jgi:hypothetical protein